ncbi:MAG: sigma factor-like helix-turn-helix DNA-binding protein [Enterococcus sp.]
MSIVQEYKNDLKSLRRRHEIISSKNETITYKVLGEEKQKHNDQRSDAEKRDQRILAEMISSTEYALFWLQNGYEEPYEKPSRSSLSKHKRDQLWGDIEACIQYRGLKSTRELYWDDIEREHERSEKKQDQIYQVNEIVSSLSAREKELFQLKHVALLSNAECAQKMGIKEGTVKSMSQRIREKIDRYFGNDHQKLSLF